MKMPKYMPSSNAILKMLKKSDGPIIEECNRALNEMVSL